MMSSLQPAVVISRLETLPPRARRSTNRTKSALSMGMCGAGPVLRFPANVGPEGLDARRRVPVRPGDGSITSCPDWFTVDRFLDDHDAIVAVALDIWEP